MEKKRFQSDLKLLLSVLHCAVPSQLHIMKPEQKTRNTLLSNEHMNISRGPSRTLGKVGLGRCNDTTSSICQVQTGINIAYLIFVISFTLAGFSKTKFYIQKTTKGTKNTKTVSEIKVKYMHFFTQSGKIYFTNCTLCSVKEMTNMRYAIFMPV